MNDNSTLETKKYNGFKTIINRLRMIERNTMIIKEKDENPDDQRY